MNETPKILGPDGKAARKANEACPRCGAGRNKREASAGFGAPHDVCSQCGYEWEELTV